MEETKCMVGDYLGTIEEFVPGTGTYVEDGKIYAAGIGKSSLDSEKHVISVSSKGFGKPAVGQTVYGEVFGFRKHTVTVIVSKIEGFDQDIDFKAEIYVSNISDKFVEKPESLFAVGDIVKAKIIKMEEGMGVDLSTKDDNGVVKAFCKQCRHPLSKDELEGDMFECSLCKFKDSRKVAKEYGSVVS